MSDELERLRAEAYAAQRGAFVREHAPAFAAAFIASGTAMSAESIAVAAPAHAAALFDELRKWQQR